MIATNDRVTLSVASGSDSGRAILAEVVASLPVSLAHAEDHGVADVLEVSAGSDWIEMAHRAISHRPKGVFITSPTATDPDQIRQLAIEADDAEVPVVLGEPFAGNPALLSAAAFVAEAIRSCESFFVTVIGSTPPAEQIQTALRVARAVGVHGLHLAAATTGSGGIVTSGTASLRAGHAGAFTALGTNTRAVAPNVRVRAYGPTMALEIDIPDASTARPARVTVTGPNGSTTVPTVYESAYRAAWLRMHAAVVQAETPDDLRRFAGDAAKTYLTVKTTLITS